MVCVQVCKTVGEARWGEGVVEEKECRWRLFWCEHWRPPLGVLRFTINEIVERLRPHFWLAPLDIPSLHSTQSKPTTSPHLWARRSSFMHDQFSL